MSTPVPTIPVFIINGEVYPVTGYVRLSEYKTVRDIEEKSNIELVRRNFPTLDIKGAFIPNEPFEIELRVRGVDERGTFAMERVGTPCSNHCEFQVSKKEVVKLLQTTTITNGVFKRKMKFINRGGYPMLAPY